MNFIYNLSLGNPVRRENNFVNGFAPNLVHPRNTKLPSLEARVHVVGA